MQNGQSLREFHLMIELNKTDDVAPTAAAVAIKQTLAGIQEKAGLVVGVERTQPHPSIPRQPAAGVPILRPQIVEQRNALF